MYTIDEAFEILSRNKLTTHKETVRNWVRKGVIQAEPLESRKKGYRISEAALEQFIKERMPDGWGLYPESVTGDVRDVVKNEDEAAYHVEIDVEAIKEQAREEMWYELLGRFIFEDYFVLKKSEIRAAVEHMRYSKEFEAEVWARCSKHTWGHATPRVPYLLDYFMFEGKRVPFNKDFGGKDEQIIHALIEKIRRDRVQGKHKKS
ncbi:DNA-binding protein [Exiguobacterium sp. SH5S13]|uniref:helix-turn-helix domain-containing protein n=1 Tax=Exiguobacterium sp. SH5S13 TaxID=2510959 RepID=UPI00104019CD|nr:helix-turn-helix domain-containing protein [Exiguobacterium sp. SH5S13]TCI50351.1 DNA-binding protein [Exiguobacterium sp. SH5S13]